MHVLSTAMVILSNLSAAILSSANVNFVTADLAMEMRAVLHVLCVGFQSVPYIVEPCRILKRQKCCVINPYRMPFVLYFDILHIAVESV